MPETEFEILPRDAIERSFDVIYDIRENPSDVAFEAAQRIGYSDLVSSEDLAEPDESILIVCDIGVRSKKAAIELRAKGFVRVTSLAGGADALRRHIATTGPLALEPEEVGRYDRQIRLAEFGISGQQRLQSARVTVVGAGGLGCPALSYLVTAGVGTVAIIDPDVVDVSNLQRQPLYVTSDVGRRKVEAASEHLGALNPHVTLVAVDALVDASNAESLIAGSDVVIDATDTFDARYALNAAAVELGVPLVYGSVYGFEGQFAVFDAASGPCYRCVFPDAPIGDAALDCATIGVLGSTTGVIGSMQASAALQIAAGVNHDLVGYLTMFDARAGRFDRVTVTKRRDCPDCSSR